jgi:hypothetical protein
MPLLPGAPLPSGWIWPFDLRSAASVFSPLAVVRPIDVSRLAPYQNRGPCAPGEVAPGIWFAPDCSLGRTKRLSGSAAVPMRKPGPPASGLPAAADLRANGLDGPVKYQQMVGICWAFALSTAMDNALRRAGRQEVIAPLHVESSGVWDDLWRKGRSERDITLESMWPYDPVKGCKLNESESEVWCDQAYHVKHGSWRSDPALVAEVEHANRTGAFRITKVEQLAKGDADQIAAALAQGQAVWVAFEYNRQAWGAIGTADPVIPDYTEEQGGHAVVAVGYRSAGPVRQFLLHNSWSSEWRERGYAWISEAMVRAHATEAFTLEVSAGANAPPPPPPPPAASTQPPWPFPVPFPGQGGAPPSSECPKGQARDLVLGDCTATCSSGSPAAARLCPAASPATGGPAQPSGGCPAGQVADWLTRACAPQCANGLPRVGGRCLP